jgi:hypothetical protein
VGNSASCHFEMAALRQAISCLWLSHSAEQLVSLNQSSTSFWHRIHKNSFNVNKFSMGSLERPSDYINSIYPRLSFSYKKLISYFGIKTKTKLNYLASVGERTTPNKRPLLVCEVSANICGLKMSRGKLNGSPRLYLHISRPLV